MQDIGACLGRFFTGVALASAAFLGAEATDQVKAHVQDGPRYRSTFDSIDECLCGPFSDGSAIDTYRRQRGVRICRKRQVAKAKHRDVFWNSQAATFGLDQDAHGDHVCAAKDAVKLGNLRE